MNLKLVTLGDNLGPILHTGYCWDCGTWLSRNDDVLPLGHGNYVCHHCARARAKNLDLEFKQYVESCNQK